MRALPPPPPAGRGAGPAGAEALPGADDAAAAVRTAVADEVAAAGQAASLPGPEQAAGPAPGPGTGADKVVAHHRGWRVVAKNFSWITASQFITAAGNLVLTPFVIHGLGVERYGLYILAGTITSYIGSFNGGLLGAAGRYFPVYAGSDDREATTRLLFTFGLMVLVLGTLVSGIDWLISPLIVHALPMRVGLRPEAVFLFRTLGILITFALLHSLVQAVVTARQRFDRAIQAALLCYGLWVGGLVLVVEDHLGLRGIAVVYLAQQAGAVLVIAPTAVQYLSRKGLGLLSRQKIREMWSFSLKLQVGTWANLVNSTIDTMVVGMALSVRTVGFYNSGNSFANQVNSVASNVVDPASVEIGNTYGSEGPEEAFRKFVPAHRAWLTVVTGWTAVGAAAGYFAVTAWLGRDFALGGWVAVIALLGSLFSLNVSLLNSYVRTVLNAGLEMRYGIVKMVANVGLTIPMALLGAVPVAIGAALASVVSANYLVHVARRQINPGIPGIWAEMPAARAAVAAALTVGLELLERPHLTPGPLGLLECVPPALVGVVAFAVLAVGPGACARVVGTAVRERRLPVELLKAGLAGRRA